MNGIKVKKPPLQQCNRLLDAVVTILKYNEITINHAIYTKAFYDVNVSYPTVSIDDVINTTNNKTAFTELRKCFKEYFEVEVKNKSVIKYLKISDFSVYHWFHY